MEQRQLLRSVCRIVHRVEVEGQRQRRLREPASSESWPGDGSITSGVPKKDRHCGQPAAMLMDSPREREKDLTLHQVRRAHRSRIPNPLQKLGGDAPRGVASPFMPPMNEVTQILSDIEAGDPHAAEQLLPLVYNELRKLAAQKLAQEKPGQTLQATALVHEAYLRLVDTDKVPHWNSRGHFFAAAAEAMRRILVENARRKGRRKRGGDWQRWDVQLNDPAVEGPAADILAVDEALEKLESQDPRKAQ